MGRRSDGDLAILQDPARMQAIFQTSLRAANGTALDVRSCTVDYVQASPMRCVLQYTLDLAGPTETPVRQVVTAVSYGPERTQELWSQLAAEPAATVGAGPLALLPVGYAAEIAALVQVFPYDYRLPGLRQLLQGGPELMTTVLVAAGLDAGRAGGWETEVVRYRPDTRAVLRITLRDGLELPAGVAAPRLYAKMYRDAEEGERAYHLLQTLWDQTAAQPAGFVVAQPLAWIADQQMLLLREAPGVRLLDLTRNAADAAAATVAMRRAARAVAGLHRLALPDGLVTVAKRDRHSQLTEVAAALSRSDPDHAAAIAEVLGAIETSFGEPLLTPTHFDLKQGHILLDAERVVLLDFDKLALGDPLVDVANLIASLNQEREGSERRVRRRAELARAFVEEYFAHVPAAWRTQFPARYALAALAEAATTGRGQRGRVGRADPQQRVAASLARARQALAGALW